MKELKKINLLMTGAGGPAAICAFKSLSKKIDKIHMADMDNLSAGLYLVPPHRRHVIPKATDPNYIYEVLQICIAHAIDLLIPTVDFELLQLAKAKELFAKEGIKILITDADILKNIMNKHTLLSYVDTCVDVGKHGMLHKENLDEWLGKKVVIKPISGSGSRGVEIYDDVRKIEVQKIQDPELMIQEFAAGPEYSVDIMVSTDGVLKAAVPRLRMRTDSGVSVTGKVDLNHEVIDYVRTVVKGLGLTLMANVQVILTKDGPRLIEINPRFSGGLSLVIESGADTPWMAICEIFGYPIEKVAHIKEIAMVRTYSETFMSATELASTH